MWRKVTNMRYAQNLNKWKAAVLNSLDQKDCDLKILARDFPRSISASAASSHQQHQHISSISASAASAHQQQHCISSISASAASAFQQHQLHALEGISAHIHQSIQVISALTPPDTTRYASDTTRHHQTCSRVQTPPDMLQTPPDMHQTPPDIML